MAGSLLPPDVRRTFGDHSRRLDILERRIDEEKTKPPKPVRGASATVAAVDSPEIFAAQATFHCDGTADQEEIQAAIALVSDSAGLDLGGTVMLLPGTFNMTSGVTVDAWGVRLVGSGRSATYLLCTGSGYVVHNDSEHGLVAHMSIESDHTGGSGGVLSLDSTNDCRAFDCYLLQNRNSSLPAVAIGGFWSSISHCHVVGDEVGILLVDSWSDMIVSNNIIEADTAIVLDRCDLSLVQGNICRGASAVDGYGILVQGAKDNIISGNMCFRYGVDGILVETASLETADRNNIQGNTIRRDSDISGTGYGIRITAGSDNLVANNDLFDSGASGEFLDGGTDTRGTGELPGGGGGGADWSVVDAKGDLIAATAADTVDNLAVGANGTFLKANSAQTTGLEWAALSDSDIPATIARDTEVTAAINAVIDAAPGALDTLNELAAALGDDPNFATTVTNALAGKIDESLADAKGDLIAATAADTWARLPLGTDGHVLTADSGETAGVKWAAAGGGGSVDLTDAFVPYYLSTGETFTVPEFRQALFVETIEFDGGTLDVEGLLIEVDQSPDLSALIHMGSCC